MNGLVGRSVTWENGSGHVVAVSAGQPWQILALDALGKLHVLYYAGVTISPEPKPTRKPEPPPRLVYTR